MLLSAPTFAADLDVFLVGGQSNAQGYGTSAQSTRAVPGKCLSFYMGQIVDANDPVGNANTGSMWPSFCRSYYAATRRAVMVVPAAVGATSQFLGCNAVAGSWDVGGILFDIAQTKLSSALSAAQASGWTPQYRGELWSQGEYDGGAIAAGRVTRAQYTMALYNMAARFRAAHPEGCLYIIRTGDLPLTNPGYAQVRDSQETVAAVHHETQNVRIVFRGTVAFKNYGLMAPDGTHYNQIGLNTVGKYVAHAVLSDGLLSDSVLVEYPYPNVSRVEFLAH